MQQNSLVDHLVEPTEQRGRSVNGDGPNYSMTGSMTCGMDRSPGFYAMMLLG